jgi:signal transduction histidine kinase
LNFLRYLFAALTALFLTCSSAFAATNEPIRLGYFKDPTHQVQVDGAAAHLFTPIANDFALGFTHDTVWLRIEIDATQESGQRFLVVRPPRLERIELFTPKEQGSGFIKVAWTPERQHLGNVFYDAFKRNVFDLYPYRDSNIFYLKIDTDNSLNGGISLLSRENIESHRTNEGFLLGGVIFGLTPFLLIFLALALYKKLPVYRVYFFALLTTTLLYLAVYGFDWAKLLFKSDIAMDHQIGFLGLLNICFSYAFLCYVCEILGAPRRQISVIKVALLACLVASPAYFWLDKQYVLEAFYACTLTLTLFIVYLIVRHFNKKDFLQWLIALLFLIICFGAAKVFMSLLGIISSSDNIFVSQTIRIVTIPFALLVLVGYYEMENNKYVLNLVLERTLSEQHKKSESERRKIYESFIAMLVHEIKTPLAVIQIAASSLSRHLIGNTAETNRINNIKKSVTEINQIFNKCIQVVDIENGSIAIEPSEFSIDFLGEDIKRTISNDKLKCTIHSRMKINTDFVLLKTVLINLISNALKYGHEDKDVGLDVSVISTTEGHWVRFTVTNKIGPVGAPDTQKIFTRYYRSESAKKFTGSGLGLWLSQELAKILGGVITVECDDSVRFSFAIQGMPNV